MTMIKRLRKLHLGGIATLAALAAGALGCGGEHGVRAPVEQRRDAIVNGTSASVAQNPGTVAVYHGFQRPCSGTLLRPNWVLTARHCLTVNNEDWGTFLNTNQVCDRPAQCGRSAERRHQPRLLPAAHRHPGAPLRAVRDPHRRRPRGAVVADGAAAGAELRSVVRSLLHAGAGAAARDGAVGRRHPRGRRHDAAPDGLRKVVPERRGVEQHVGRGTPPDGGRGALLRVGHPGELHPGERDPLHRLGRLGRLVVRDERQAGRSPQPRRLAPGNHEGRQRALRPLLDQALDLVSGTVSGSSRTDIALVGGNGWTNFHWARSQGDGSFVRNTASGYAVWTAGARTAFLRPLELRVGRAEQQGRGRRLQRRQRLDIAVVGGLGTDLPFAYAMPDGTFLPAYVGAGSFATTAQYSGATPVSAISTATGERTSRSCTAAA